MSEETKMASRRNKPPSVAFCPEHGRLDKVDEDGLCPGCGASCMGDEIDKLVAKCAQLEADLAKEREKLHLEKTVADALSVARDKPEASAVFLAQRAAEEMKRADEAEAAAAEYKDKWLTVGAKCAHVEELEAACAEMRAALEEVSPFIDPHSVLPADDECFRMIDEIRHAISPDAGRNWVSPSEHAKLKEWAKMVVVALSEEIPPCKNDEGYGRCGVCAPCDNYCGQIALLAEAEELGVR